MHQIVHLLHRNGALRSHSVPPSPRVGAGEDGNTRFCPDIHRSQVPPPEHAWFSGPAPGVTTNSCPLIGPPLPLPRLEEVYLVYTAEKNRGLTLRLHYMLATAWAVGSLKTVAQAVFALREGEKGILLQYAFLLLAQLVNLGYQLASMPRLRSMARQDQLQQERTKAWLHVLLDVAVMVCVILSDPSLPHSPAPLSAMVMTSFLAVLDMVSAAGARGAASGQWAFGGGRWKAGRGGCALPAAGPSHPAHYRAWIIFHIPAMHYTALRWSAIRRPMCPGVGWGRGGICSWPPFSLLTPLPSCPHLSPLTPFLAGIPSSDLARHPAAPPHAGAPRHHAPVVPSSHLPALPASADPAGHTTPPARHQVAVLPVPGGRPLPARLRAPTAPRGR